MSFKLEPVIWLRVVVTLAYMKGRTDVRTDNEVMAILPNFLPPMGYQYFLSYGAAGARAFGARGAPLICSSNSARYCLGIVYHCSAMVEVLGK